MCPQAQTYTDRLPAAPHAESEPHVSPGAVQLA